MENLKYKELKYENKEYSNGKSSKDCTYEEAYKVYKETVSKAETMDERKKRINAYRCGW